MGRRDNFRSFKPGEVRVRYFSGFFLACVRYERSENLCGIVGQFPPPNRKFGEKLLREIAHRGPDGQDSFYSEIGFLAQSRLAIVDLSERARQPFIEESGRFSIVFNGEVYNHLDLRRELETLGHRFSSKSDTEVILRGFVEWGTKVFARLVGMFAIAILDSRENELVLARDSMGIKPLLIWSGNRRLVFSSELRTFLGHPWVRKDYSESAIRDLFLWGAVSQPGTILKHVFQLEPGHFMRYSVVSGEAIARRFGNPTWAYPEPYSGTYRESLQDLSNLFSEVVRYHSAADVEVGCLLSGGLDSGIVLSLLQSQSRRPIPAFTLGFSEDGNLDESEAAKFTAEEVGADFHLVRYSDAEVAGLFQAFVEAIDQPSIDGFNTFLISKYAAGFVKVVLTGLGSDEIFGGYRHFKEISMLYGMGSTYLPQLVLPGWLNTPFNRRLQMVGKSLPEMLSTVRTITQADWGHYSSSFGPVGIQGPVRERYKGSHISELSRAEIDGYLRNTLLRDTDAVSMRFGLEVRPPFLDLSLVEFGLSLPDSFKLRHGVTKAILKDYSRELLPAKISRARKKGFELPFRRWLNGPLNGQFVSTVSGPAAKEVMGHEAIENVVSRAHSRKLERPDWLLMVLFSWMDANL